MSGFEVQDWATSEFGHLEGREDLPPAMPQPQGIGFIVSALVDADHASESMVIDNDGICAVCEFVHVKTSIDTSCLKPVTVQEDTMLSLYHSTLNKQSISFKPERAPPYSA